MTIDEIMTLLQETQAQLEQEGIDDLARLKLERLIIDLKTQMIMSSFDPLRDISQMSVVNVAELRQLVPQLRQVIRDEQRRTALILRIAGIAKSALRGAGLPIPL